MKKGTHIGVRHRGPAVLRTEGVYEEVMPEPTVFEAQFQEMILQAKRPKLAHTPLWKRIWPLGMLRTQT